MLTLIPSASNLFSYSVVFLKIEKNYIMLRTLIRLKRRVGLHIKPKTLFSLRFFSKNISSTTLLHKAVFMQSWRCGTKDVRFWIQLLSWINWFAFLSWFEIVRHFIINARNVSREYHIPLWKQFSELVYVALYYGIPPEEYYLFSLFQSIADIEDYVYCCERKVWHDTFQLQRAISGFERPISGLERSISANNDSIELLRDKARFSEEIRRCGVITTPTLVFLASGASDLSPLFQQKSLFLKPVSGSRAQNCFKLTFDSSSEDYELEHYQRDNSHAYYGKPEIQAFVQKLVMGEPYIVQPLLVNHPWFDCVATSELCVFRIITANDSGRVELVAGVLEITGPDGVKQNYNVNIDTGTISVSHVDCTVPDWIGICESCMKAHAQLSDLLTIGWDLALTPEGVVLLEGNYSWATFPIQATLQQPLLQTELASFYQKRLKQQSV
ncbi:sugar-transfer associated ATP-grasp domain-containing protein [Oleiphilus messinensis]|nr:sugar-transfer associated ATP-grasp domain-containing protein [Oleiphilus messinensis]